MASGCASDQILRGKDYVRTEKPEPEIREDSFLFQLMPYVVWGSLVIGIGVWTVKEFKKTN